MDYIWKWVWTCFSKYNFVFPSCARRWSKFRFFFCLLYFTFFLFCIFFFQNYEQNNYLIVFFFINLKIFKFLIGMNSVNIKFIFIFDNQNRKKAKKADIVHAVCKANFFWFPVWKRVTWTTGTMRTLVWNLCFTSNTYCGRTGDCD